jgi:hypothetical protein
VSIAPANECVPFYDEGDAITCYSTIAVVGKRFVKVSATRQAGPGLNTSTSGGNISVAPADAGGRVFGVARQDAGIGVLVTVLRDPGSILPITADGSITAGDPIQVGALGKAKTAAGGVAAVSATATTGVVGSNNALTYTAHDSGAAGNGISVQILGSTGNSVSLSVAVTGNDIVVTPATNSSGVITSTATLVAAAIAASAAAASLVTATNTGASTGAGVVAAAGPSNLAGGSEGVIVGMAVADATDGTDAQISYRA